MKISNEQVRKVLQDYVRQVDGKKSAKTQASHAKAEGAAKDTVTITARSEELERAKEAYDKLSDTRNDLVDEIKSKLRSGDYDVAGKDVADKIIHRAIVDKEV